MTLFDLEPPPPLVEPLEGGYHYIRNRYGVLPYAHLIAGASPNSAVVTLCGRIGTKMSDVGVTSMVRCGECDAAQQLL